MSLWLKPQGLAGRNEQLGLDDVDAGHELGHRVFDLHAGVHFDEVELIVLIEELESAGAAVADFPARPGAALAHGLALLGGRCPARAPLR